LEHPATVPRREIATKGDHGKGYGSCGPAEKFK
jgi:hypothetical protein